MSRIFLSASSQEKNLGTIAGYIEEIECNKIARAAGAILERSGHIVGYNNPGETYIQHVERAIAFKADIIICIHSNAAGDPTASGMRAGCYDHTAPERESTKLAQAIFNALAPVTPSLSDKMTTYRFYEVTKNVPPVAYIELSFHTNRVDCEWILTKTDFIGRKFAEGISNYLKTPIVADIDWEAKYNLMNNEFEVRLTALAEQLTQKTTALTVIRDTAQGNI